MCLLQAGTGCVATQQASRPLCLVRVLCGAPSPGPSQGPEPETHAQELEMPSWHSRLSSTRIIRELKKIPGARAHLNLGEAEPLELEAGWGFLKLLRHPLRRPRWCSGKESSCQCRRRRRHLFDPWVRRGPLRRKWQPPAVFLPGKSHRLRSLVGYSPRGLKEDTTETA